MIIQTLNPHQTLEGTVMIVLHSTLRDNDTTIVGLTSEDLESLASGSRVEVTSKLNRRIVLVVEEDIARLDWHLRTVTDGRMPPRS